ncbi:MAG TPA: ARMT1-like domain-containing protein [Methanocorpusculum sp.]|nr:ARMT1-like domain-containing protein [Methanocorpusculum sp.]
MQLAPECRNCLLTKVRGQSGLVTKDEALLDAVTEKCTMIYDSFAGRNLGAAVIAGRVHRCCYAEIGTSDPYSEIKVRDNEVAKRVVDAVSPRLSTLHDYMVASILGNSIDYGVTGHEVATDFVAFFEKMFAKGLALDDSEEFFQIADRVVYFTDNCGEVIFDKLFCEALRKNGSEVTIVVKEKPMLNDVTLKEAADVHLEEAADALYHSGGGAQIGAHPKYFPPEVLDAVSKATLIIAKGLANYESLTEYDIKTPIAYLMMVKCVPVGRNVGAEKGDLIAILRRQ